jgi:hypothetical protein
MAAYDFFQQFDSVRKLQYVNNDPSVMHCHHYSCLFTRLAMDMTDIEGPELLADSMEEAMYLVLRKTFLTGDVKSAPERIAIAVEHFRLSGLGLLRIDGSPKGGSAEMRHSHIDEGWIKKWKQHTLPVNHMGRGFLAAAFCTAYDKPLRSYVVTETRSIVTGASTSRFEIALREKE